MPLFARMKASFGLQRACVEPLDNVLGYFRCCVQGSPLVAFTGMPPLPPHAKRHSLLHGSFLLEFTATLRRIYIRAALATCFGGSALARKPNVHLHYLFSILAVTFFSYLKSRCDGRGGSGARPGMLDGHTYCQPATCRCRVGKDALHTRHW